jgi:hypothetical protein
LSVWLARSEYRLPSVPAGDIVVVVQPMIRLTAVWGAAVERADRWLRQWPVASLSLLLLAIALGAAMLASR